MDKNGLSFVAPVALCLLALTVLWPSRVAAEGAVAVGIAPGGVAQGYAIGYGMNQKTVDLARRQALAGCRKSRDSNSAATGRCKVVTTFHNQCVSSAIDPKAGTPGAGWAVGDTQKAADGEALSRCRNTAGADRRAFCEVADRHCDGDAK